MRRAATFARIADATNPHWYIEGDVDAWPAVRMLGLIPNVSDGVIRVRVQLNIDSGTVSFSEYSNPTVTNPGTVIPFLRDRLANNPALVIRNGVQVSALGNLESSDSCSGPDGNITIEYVLLDTPRLIVVNKSVDATGDFYIAFERI